MTDLETLDERLRAVERALTDADRDLTDLQGAAAVADDLDELADRLAALERRADDLDTATQALRGYVGNVRAVNEAVERRADAALAAAESARTAVEATAETAGETTTETADGTYGRDGEHGGTTDPSPDCDCDRRRPAGVATPESVDTGGRPVRDAERTFGTEDPRSDDADAANDLGVLTRLAALVGIGGTRVSGSATEARAPGITETE
ncbi:MULTISPECIES: DUF7310 family coiled-coil domain-containing protein [Halorussus]|uniref:DUF7310 family coiled-coil domain-containing protein n=1 Tax=Halorussus TaxID=1070314 RepID=UPI00209FAA82|nr:hypothetical protein [Halorussus vallis]USZ75407.1 hypothetical protein NGM07_18485 [Halorussus vallis]